MEQRKVKLLKPEEFELMNQGVKEKRDLLFEVKLPSRGRHGYAEIVRCRPLKVADIKPLIVTKIEDEIAYLKRVVEVLQRTVVEPEGFNLLDISWNDLLKLVVAHRVNSLGSVVEIGGVCGSCGARNFWKVDLVNDLEEVPLSDEYGKDPLEIKGVRVNFPRVRRFLQAGVTSFEEITDLDLIEGGLVGYKLEDLDIGTYFEIVDVIRKHGDYGVQMKVGVKCSKCGVEAELVLPFFLFLVSKRIV